MFRVDQNRLLALMIGYQERFNCFGYVGYIVDLSDEVQMPANMEPEVLHCIGLFNILPLREDRWSVLYWFV